MGLEPDSPEPSDNEEINSFKCRAVEQSKELGWVLKGYPTVPADAILESVGRGLDVEQIGKHFDIPAEAARLVYYAIPGYHWIACPGVEQDGSDNPFIVGTNVPAEAVRNLSDHNLSYGEIAQRLSLSEHQVRAIIEFRSPLLPDEFGYDWTGCEEVVQVRGMRGGVPILKRIGSLPGLSRVYLKTATRQPESAPLTASPWNRSRESWSSRSRDSDFPELASTGMAVARLSDATAIGSNPGVSKGRILTRMW